MVKNGRLYILEYTVIILELRQTLFQWSNLILKRAIIYNVDFS